MTGLSNFKNGFGVKSYVSTCIEFYPAPLPIELPENNESLKDSYDLFHNSRQFGFEPIFINSNEIIVGEIDQDNLEIIPGTEKKIDPKEFLKFQLSKINLDTLIQIPGRVDFTLSDDLISNILKSTISPDIKVDEMGYPLDQSNWPEWLNHADNLFNIHKPADQYVDEWKKTLEIGKKFLSDFRISHSNLILDPMVDSILDQDSGVFNHLEKEINNQNINEIRNSYKNWNCPLMILYSGKMWPSYTGAGWPNFHSTNHSINKIYLRNYDEGTPI